MAQSKEIFFADLIDDYYAECDEHLATMRRSLLALESSVDQLHIDRSPLDELFRSFHTIKGLSGMVGLKEAQQLAHNVESCLRPLRKGDVSLTSEYLDLLMTSARLLEQVIEAYRQKKPVPDLSVVTAELSGCIPDGISSGDLAGEGVLPAASATRTLDPEKMRHLEQAIEKGSRAWCLEFTPHPLLAQRGVNVNVIRSRLKEMGELVHAYPEMSADGKIKFGFVVVSSQSEENFEALKEDGVAFRPFSPTALPASARPMRSLLSSNVVRVDLSRLDGLIQTLGELVIGRAHLEDNLRRLEFMLPAFEWRALQDVNISMERHLRELREGIMRLRMIPVRDLFERMQFGIYDLAREHRKKIVVELQGGETEIDKYVVERMMDPLLHLVRNAVSHGIEPEQERIAGGKPPEGRLLLKAHTSGDVVVVEVEDDGRGIDTELVLKKARSLGFTGSGSSIDEAALLDVLCEIGFTTLEQADVTSGRGVGMAVVKNAVRELGGTISLDTHAGLSTRFTVRLPMTLAIVNALIVSVGEQTFALPVSSVREIIEVNPADVRLFEKNEIIPYRAGVLPFIRLAKIFGLREKYVRAFYAIVIGTDSNPAGIAVDRLFGRREIVVRTLSDPLVQVPGISGATELGDGRAVLILDPSALMYSARKGADRPG